MNPEEQKINAFETELINAHRNRDEFTISQDWQDSVMKEINEMQSPNVIFIDGFLWKFATVSSIAASLITIAGFLLGSFDIQNHYLPNLPATDFFLIDSYDLLEV